MTTSSAGKLIRHSSVYALGTLSRQLISFIMLPVYTRYMTPADYGIVGLLAFTLALIEPLIGARLSEAIPKFYFEQKNEPDRRTVISTALTITGGISACAAVLICLFRKPESTLLFGTDDYSLLVAIFGVQILTQALEAYGYIFLRIQERPVAFVTMSLSKLAMQLALNIWLVVFWHMGAAGVVIGGGVASAAYGLGLTVYVLRQNGASFSLSMAKRMLMFNMPLWLSGLAALYIFSSNRYFIRTFGSLDQVGLYELAARLAGVLPLLVWAPFAQFWEIERFKRYHAGDRASFGKVFRSLSTLMVLVALGISLFAEPFIELMSAPSFHAASTAVPLITLGMLFNSLSGFMNFSFLITEKTRIINRNSYIGVAIVTALNFALIPKFGYLGAAVGLMLTFVTQFFLINSQAKLQYDMEIALRPLLVMIGAAVVSYLLCLLVPRDAGIMMDIALRFGLYGLFTLLLIGMLWRDPATRVHLIVFQRYLNSKLRPRLKNVSKVVS